MLRQHLVTCRVVLAPTLMTPDRGSILLAVQAAPEFTDPSVTKWWPSRDSDFKSLLYSPDYGHGGGRGYRSCNNLMAKLLQWNMRVLQANREDLSLLLSSI